MKAKIQEIIKKSNSQKEAVLNHLKEFGSIDAMNALNNYGAYRLSDIILKLRRDGFEIQTEMIPHVSHFGEKGKFARYNYSQLNK